MKVYLDVIFIINFLFDLLLVCATKIILKRIVKFYRLVLASIFGALSIFLLFLNINSLQLFIFKILISIIMLLIAFDYRNFKYFMKNFLTLYIVSIFLGGALYLLNIEFSYKQEGLIFFHNGMSINVIALLILSPFIIAIYIKENRSLKNNYAKYYIVKLCMQKQIIELNGYLDTGNNLCDNVSKKLVILVDKKLVEPLIHIHSPIYVPYRSLNNHGVVECYKVDYVMINKHKYKNILIGLSEPIKLDNVNCILNNRMEL